MVSTIGTQVNVGQVEEQSDSILMVEFEPFRPGILLPNNEQTSTSTPSLDYQDYPHGREADMFHVQRYERGLLNSTLAIDKILILSCQPHKIHPT